MTPTCILAANNHALMRSLKRVLEPELEVVAMVDNLASVRDSIASLAPDLVVVDLALLGPSSNRSLRVLLDRFPETPMIGLSEDNGNSFEVGESGLADIVSRRLAASVLVGSAKKALAR